MKIGDKISVLDDNMKGKITALNGKKITVEDEHGFSHTFHENEIVLQNPEIYHQIKMVQKEEFSKPKSKKHAKQPLILDLHFENFGKNSGKIDAFERLFLQKEKLLKTLDFCRENNLKRLEIIHGIGDGVLQQMVHDVLESQTNLEFHNKEILHHQSGTVLVYFR